MEKSVRECSAFDDFSIFANSVLCEHAANKSKIADYDSDMKSAAGAFVNESAQAFGLEPLDGEGGDKRFELIRPFIIKILLYLDLGLDVNALAPLARIIESTALHPETDLNSLVGELSALWQVSTNVIFKLIRKAFNVYDPSFTDKLSALTCSQPFTARDVVSDLAVYVRAKYLNGARYYARNDR